MEAHVYDPEMTPEMLRSLLSLRDEILTHIMTAPTVRPDFGPTQIRSFQELLPGMRVRNHHKLGTRDGTIVSVDPEGETMDVKYDDWGFVHKGFLSDCGVVPYRGQGISGEDTWNPTNWLERL